MELLIEVLYSSGWVCLFFWDWRGEFSLSSNPCLRVQGDRTGKVAFLYLPNVRIPPGRRGPNVGPCLRGIAWFPLCRIRHGNDPWYLFENEYLKYIYRGSFFFFFSKSLLWNINIIIFTNTISIISIIIISIITIIIYIIIIVVVAVAVIIIIIIFRTDINGPTYGVSG